MHSDLRHLHVEVESEEEEGEGQAEVTGSLQFNKSVQSSKCDFDKTTALIGQTVSNHKA